MKKGYNKDTGLIELGEYLCRGCCNQAVPEKPFRIDPIIDIEISDIILDKKDYKSLKYIK